MNRRLFLTYSCTLAAASVAASLVRCSSDNNDSGGGGDNNPKLTADLNTELTTIGSSKSQNRVVVVRVAEGNLSGSFVALTNVCTHKACTVGYQSAQNQFVCPCHGSRYNINGGVVQGPASAPLAKYAVSINNNILTVI